MTAPESLPRPRVGPRVGPRGVIALVALVALALVAGGGLLGARLLDGPAPIRIGAVFPIESNAAALVGPELAGVRIAADLVNADGGIAGRPVELVVRNLAARDDAPSVMRELKDQGIGLVIGAYSSDLSIAAWAAADGAGLVYWESGAVADRLTGRGLPRVFRVGTSGSTLGTNSATFAATELAARLGKEPSDLRVAIAVADDEYARSVADAAEATARAAGLVVAARETYNLTLPQWPTVMADLAAARPDVIILASHIPDGIAFRQAMLAAGLRVGALIGSTMAECDPDFAGDLGADAVGIFASDRPTAGFRPDALGHDARIAYDRFATAGATQPPASRGPADRAGGDASGHGDANGHGDAVYGNVEYPISGPAESATAEQSEEALAGFSAAWTLFKSVLPNAVDATSGLDPERVAAVARGLDLPQGALPNGA